MKITFIGHACIMIETREVTILSDPWWRRPCFGAQWWNYPPAHLEALEGRHIDYIYVSHGHHDHFHPGTLRTINRDAKILISRQTDLSSDLTALGFNVIVLDSDQLFNLSAGVTCRIIETHNQDTLMAISDGEEVCLNLNDSLHSAPQPVKSEFTRRLKRLYPNIDYVFCGYGVASHFPNCYDIPGKNKEATAARRQQYFNQQWARLIDQLAPRHGFPFAADVVFLEDDLFWVNEPTHNVERPTDSFHSLYPESRVAVLDIAPGFAIKHGEILNKAVRGPILANALKSICVDEIDRANRVGAVDESGVKEIMALIQKNLDSCADYFASYGADYRFLIQFRNSAFGISIEKHNHTIRQGIIRRGQETNSNYDVIYTTRVPYLKRSLTMPYGDEILFVGSGGVFKYTDQASAKRNLHRELMEILRKHQVPLASRSARSLGMLYRVKQVAKRVVSNVEPDLYDLNAWTVFSESK